jgi:hypothetical protein
MSIIHYIFTRFSILDKTCKGFQLTRNNADNNIENVLFDENRLNYKFNVFHNMTFPSIKNQTYQNYVWLIFTSNYLPQKYKNILEKYSCDKIKIIYVENFNEMSEYIKNIEKNSFSYSFVPYLLVGTVGDCFVVFLVIVNIYIVYHKENNIASMIKRLTFY